MWGNVVKTVMGNEAGKVSRAQRARYLDLTLRSRKPLKNLSSDMIWFSIFKNFLLECTNGTNIRAGNMKGKKTS